jgi:hypothetical protein
VRYQGVWSQDKVWDASGRTAEKRPFALSISCRGILRTCKAYITGNPSWPQKASSKVASGDPEGIFQKCSRRKFSLLRNSAARQIRTSRAERNDQIDRVSRKRQRGYRSRLVPIAIVVTSTTTLVIVLLAVLEVFLAVVVVSHIVILILVELVVLELLDLVVFRVLLLRGLAVRLVPNLVVLVKVGKLVAGGLCVDFERLFAGVRVAALAFGVDYVPELFGEVFLFCFAFPTISKTMLGVSYEFPSRASAY